MASKAHVDAFVAERTLAIVGVSRSGKKFGNAVLKELSGKGYRLFPIHREAASIDGHTAYASLSGLPAPVGGVIVVVSPAQALQVVRDAHAAGISRVWLQQGASSPEAIAYCHDNNISVIHDECILMFAEPTAWFHRAHRWVWGAIGKLPA